MKKIVFFVIILCLIFGIFYYKNFLFGNNIIKNRSSNKVDIILNSFENYCADMSVKVISNKTENNYNMYQEVNKESSIQEIKDGEYIEGLRIELSQNNLKISNSKLKLEKIYENYQDLLNNSLFLNSFVADYENEDNDSDCYEENGEIILKVKLNNNQNTYAKYKKLYLDSKTKKPTKLEVKNKDKKQLICIVYNNIEINTVKM